MKKIVSISKQILTLPTLWKYFCMINLMENPTSLTAFDFEHLITALEVLDVERLDIERLGSDMLKLDCWGLRGLPVWFKLKRSS